MGLRAGDCCVSVHTLMLAISNSSLCLSSAAALLAASASRWNLCTSHTTFTPMICSSLAATVCARHLSHVSVRRPAVCIGPQPLPSPLSDPPPIQLGMPYCLCFEHAGPEQATCRSKVGPKCMTDDFRFGTLSPGLGRNNGNGFLASFDAGCTPRMCGHILLIQA